MDAFVKASSDIFIKYLWGSERNKDLLLSFINTVLADAGFPLISGVEIKNPFNAKRFRIDKEAILDVRATDKNGRQYDIEVQSTGDNSFKYRSLYYWARMYSGQLKESDAYGRLKPTICINILDFVLFKDLKKVHNCFLLMEKSNPEYVLTDHIALHFIELPKLAFDRHMKTKLGHWVYFLAMEGKEDENMKILIRDDEDISKAYKEYKHFTEDEQLRELYEARQKWRRDYVSAMSRAHDDGIKEGIEQGIEKGIEQGIEKGIEKQNTENARKMLLAGIDIPVIQKITGLSETAIRRLKKAVKVND